MYPMCKYGMVWTNFLSHAYFTTGLVLYLDLQKYRHWNCLWQVLANLISPLTLEIHRNLPSLNSLKNCHLETQTLNAQPKDQSKQFVYAQKYYETVKNQLTMNKSLSEAFLKMVKDWSLHGCSRNLPLHIKDSKTILSQCVQAHWLNLKIS